MLLQVFDTREGHPSARGPCLIESIGLCLPHVLLGLARLKGDVMQLHV